MKNKKGFTLIELLAVIVVLAIVTVIATQSVLPFMSSARRDAFAIEATDVVNSAESALSFYNLGKVTIAGDANSCKSGNKVCFTITKLIDLGLYEGDKNIYKGKVEIDITNSSVPTYTLYAQKGAEFSIVNSDTRDFTKDGSDIVDGGFASGKVNEYTSCSCS